MRRSMRKAAAAAGIIAGALLLASCGNKPAETTAAAETTTAAAAETSAAAAESTAAETTAAALDAPENYGSVTLGDYKGVDVEVHDVNVTDDEVQSYVDSLVSYNPVMKEVDRAAKDGDTVNIDYVGKKDGVDQMHSYASACMNSTYGMWTNGDELLTFRYVNKAGKRVPDPVPDLPHAGGEVPDDAPQFDQLRPAASDSLLYSFRRCHNYIAGNQGIQKAEAFLELLKIIFCKIQDERDSPAPTFYITPTERQGAAGRK